MQQVKNIVKGPYEPQDNTVVWIDTSNPDAPIAKVHSNGEWKAISGVDNLPTVLNEIVELSDPIIIDLENIYNQTDISLETALSYFKVNGKSVSYDEMRDLFNEKRNILLRYNEGTIKYRLLESTRYQDADSVVEFVFGTIDYSQEIGYLARIKLAGDESRVEFYLF